jgi:hypothetical protein
MGINCGTRLRTSAVAFGRQDDSNLDDGCRALLTMP